MGDIFDRIPHFSGIKGTVKVEHFLEQIEVVGEIFSINDKQKVNLAKFFTEKVARNFVSDDPIINTENSWDQFKIKIKNRFEEKLSFVQARLNISKCIQKENESLDEYVDRLRYIGNFLYQPSDFKLNSKLSDTLDRELLAYFVYGIKTSIQKDVLIRNPQTLEEGLKLAKHIENIDNYLADSNKPLTRIVDLVSLNTHDISLAANTSQVKNKIEFSNNNLVKCNGKCDCEIINVKDIEVQDSNIKNKDIVIEEIKPEIVIKEVEPATNELVKEDSPVKILEDEKQDLVEDKLKSEILIDEQEESEILKESTEEEEIIEASEEIQFIEEKVPESESVLNEETESVVQDFIVERQERCQIEEERKGRKRRKVEQDCDWKEKINVKISKNTICDKGYTKICLGSESGNEVDALRVKKDLQPHGKVRETVDNPVSHRVKGQVTADVEEENLDSNAIHNVLLQYAENTIINENDEVNKTTTPDQGQHNLGQYDNLLCLATEKWLYKPPRLKRSYG